MPSLECGGSAERYIGERRDGDPISFGLQVSHMTTGVTDVVHTYATVQSGIQVVGIVHVPRTRPDWTRGAVATAYNNRNHNHKQYKPNVVPIHIQVQKCIYNVTMAVSAE